MSPLLTGLTWLLVFQCIGEVLVRATGAPVPGPVVGMVLLFALLRWRAVRGDRGGTSATTATTASGAATASDPAEGPVAGTSVPAGLAVAADGLLKHLSLLFVPAGVGVMLHASRLADEWLAIAVALVASTVAAIAATALTMRALMPHEAHVQGTGVVDVEGGSHAASGDRADRSSGDPR
jgi:holin-like protein